MSTRAEVRSLFAALLRADLAGPGQLAQAVYDHHVGDFQGQSPVLVVGSAGTEPAQFGKRTWQAGFFLEVFAFVLYALKDGTWTEADADSLLDQIETGVAEVVAAHQKSAHWQGIEYADRTEAAGYVPVGGETYRREVILLRFTGRD